MSNDPFCCGKNRKSKFCPECGRVIITSGPLGELVVHLLTIVGQKKKEAAKIKQWFDNNDGKERRNRRFETCEKTVAKYQEWADELQKLLNRKENP